MAALLGWMRPDLGWLALDDVPRESGCVEVLPGSHTGGLATPDGGNVPAALVAAAGADTRPALPAVAGEVILPHNHTWHAAPQRHRPRAAPSRSVT
jgi:ectoine hydroxylase-related dioxygenase (phytanoyl-CoA dioxygenase family)